MNLFRVSLLVIMTVSLPWMIVNAQEQFLLRCEQNSKVYGPYEFKEAQKIINEDFCLASVKDDKFRVHGFIRGIKRVWGPFTFTNGMVMTVADVPLELISGKAFVRENNLRIKKEQAYEAECIAKGMEKFEGQWATKEQIAEIKERRLQEEKRQQAESDMFVSKQKLREQRMELNRKRLEESLGNKISDETTDVNVAADKAKEFVRKKMQEGVIIVGEFLKVAPIKTQCFIEELPPNNNFSKRQHAWFKFAYLDTDGTIRTNIGPINVAFLSGSQRWQVVHFGKHAITGTPYHLTEEGDAAIGDYANRTIGEAFSGLGGNSSNSKKMNVKPIR